ncbi:MAG: LuxR C-terminal-related transcriptional regulator, partial [Muribaculaceae bacterium]|nr:LuxR C-terminal-related transcriptional regulator [Muribaculaceae bacterium]
DLSGHTWEKRSVPALNETEKAIITLSIQGLTMNAIAEKIHITSDSVKTARRRLYENPVHFCVQIYLITAIVHFCVQGCCGYIGNFELRFYPTILKRQIVFNREVCILN